MAPEIRMSTKISGTRNGKDWPNPGSTIEVPQAEADQLVGSGQAVFADQPENTEQPSGDVETATRTGNRSAREIAKDKADADAKAKQAAAEQEAKDKADADAKAKKAAAEQEAKDKADADAKAKKEAGK